MSHVSRLNRGRREWGKIASRRNPRTPRSNTRRRRERLGHQTKKKKHELSTPIHVLAPSHTLSSFASPLHHSNIITKHTPLSSSHPRTYIPPCRSPLFSSSNSLQGGRTGLLETICSLVYIMRICLDFLGVGHFWGIITTVVSYTVCYMVLLPEEYLGV